MFLTKSSYWFSIWRRTSEIKENKHRNIKRLIYLAHFISNLYSISVFKDSRKVRKFTVIQLYWRRDAIHWGKKYWQECENTEKRSKNRFHMSWEQCSAIWWLEIWTDTLWKTQDNTQSNSYSTQQHNHKIKNKKENQYQKHTVRVNLSYRSLKKLRKIDWLTFSTFIQLKMRHDYFKSYLHRLSENKLNKCYEICKARQTLKHLLLNCKHYRAEQLQLKAKAQFKNTNIILMLFIIKIERIAMLEYLKSTWIATRKWLLRMKE